MSKNININKQELLNALYALKKRNLLDEDCVHYIIDMVNELSKDSLEEETTLYEDVCMYINRINCGDSEIKFIKNSGKLDEKKFYDYAQIGKNTWSNIRLSAKGITKENALKLVIPLQLNINEACALLQKASWCFNNSDCRDRLIIALIKAECFNPYEVAIILEEYGKGKYKFENIYDMDKFPTHCT